MLKLRAYCRPLGNCPERRLTRPFRVRCHSFLSNVSFARRRRTDEAIGSYENGERDGNDEHRSDHHR